jgi:hypothetical protein
VSGGGLSALAGPDPSATWPNVAATIVATTASIVCTRIRRRAPSECTVASRFSVMVFPFATPSFGSAIVFATLERAFAGYLARGWISLEVCARNRQRVKAI